MTTVTIHEAKTHLSRLIARVLAGDEIIIARGREEVARLVPVKPISKAKRVPGRLNHLTKGEDPLAHGFWDPLPEDHLGL